MAGQSDIIRKRMPIASGGRAGRRQEAGGRKKLGAGGKGGHGEKTRVGERVRERKGETTTGEEANLFHHSGNQDEGFIIHETPGAIAV
ncbi:MAG: hypothetical protein RRA32_08055 [bacterium]|nr:hypothetical protein [bacterium]